MGLLVLGVSFAVLLLIRTPIAIAMGTSSLVYFVFTSPFPLRLIPERMYQSLYSFPLLAVPLFILAGALMNAARLSERMFNLANAIVGHIPGGLGHVNVLASMIFAGTSGSAIADASGLGRIEVKAMLGAQYSKPFTAAITSASGTIGPIIPPSIALVVYAVIAEVSVPRIFLAGVLPGVIMGVLLMAYIYLLASTGREQCFIKPRPSRSEFAQALWQGLPPIFSPIIILGSLVLGIATPTEAAAIAVIYSAILGWLYRELSIKKIFEALHETMVGTTSVMFVISVTSVFAWIFAIEQVPRLVTTSILIISKNPLVFLLLLNIALLITGMFMDTLSILIIVVPIIVPTARVLGINLEHLGIVVVLNLMIGLLTPPVGLILFIVKDLVGLSLLEISRAVLPYLLVLIVALLIMILFPQVVLWLPDLFL